MRTVLFLVAGFLLLAAALILGRLFSWLVVAGSNMWVGVAKAGYSVAEELPIFALVFGLPAVIAILLKWKLL